MSCLCSKKRIWDHLGQLPSLIVTFDKPADQQLYGWDRKILSNNYLGSVKAIIFRAAPHIIFVPLLTSPLPLPHILPLVVTQVAILGALTAPQ